VLITYSGIIVILQLFFTWLLFIVGESGLTVEVMSWGATITKFMAEDGTDIVLGFDNFKGKSIEIIDILEKVLSWGATITKFLAEDGTDIVLGFDNFKGRYIEIIDILEKVLYCPGVPRSPSL
jgi:hypothetical protein